MGKLYVITEDKAKGYLPILRWYRDQVTTQREKKIANSLISKLTDVKDWKQLTLSSQEYNLLSAVMEEFPEGSLVDRQLRLPGI